MSFDKIMEKEECSEWEYMKYKELFDAAVKSGHISLPQRFEKRKISHDKKEEISYSYTWKLK